jgi:hypothetical protein
VNGVLSVKRVPTTASAFSIDRNHLSACD